MRTQLPDMPSLASSCSQIRQECLLFSGLNERALDDATIELEVDYGVWCAEYKGPDLADSFMGFGEMLHQWSLPWPYHDESGLNGLTVAQFYFVWAYCEAEVALMILAQPPSPNIIPDSDRGYCTADDAARAAIVATKALMHAKHLLASNDSQLAQAPC